LPAWSTDQETNCSFYAPFDVFSARQTDGVDFFEADNLPELSVSRVLDYQITRMFAHSAAPHLPTEFDR
jgi:hypothetical protein